MITDKTMLLFDEFCKCFPTMTNTKKDEQVDANT